LTKLPTPSAAIKGRLQLAQNDVKNSSTEPNKLLPALYFAVFLSSRALTTDNPTITEISRFIKILSPVKYAAWTQAIFSTPDKVASR
jgi:hypothetical protein